MTNGASVGGSDGPFVCAKTIVCSHHQQGHSHCCCCSPTVPAVFVRQISQKDFPGPILRKIYSRGGGGEGIH